MINHNCRVIPSRFFKYGVSITGCTVLLLLFVSNQVAHAQAESCHSTLQNTLNRVSEMRRVTMEWYSEAIFSMGVRKASADLQPRSNAATILSDEAFSVFYSCQSNERSARQASDADRIDAVIDNAQKFSEHALPRSNQRAFSAGSEILRYTWKRQFEQLTDAFDSTNDWGKAPRETSHTSGINYQSRLFRNNSTTRQNYANTNSREIDRESTAYLDQLESVSDILDDVAYNEITTRSDDIGARREERREREIEAYRREHERLMRNLQAIGSSSPRQNRANYNSSGSSESGCASESQAAAIRARGGTPTCR